MRSLWFDRRLARRETARLILRPLGLADLAALDRMHRDPRVMATLGGVRTPVESARFVDETMRHWHVHGFGLWAAFERTSDAFVGRGGLRRLRLERAWEVEVAWAILPGHQRRGYATELARAAVEVGLGELGLRNLVAFTQTTNRASRRVMERCGFRFERTFLRTRVPHLLYRLRAHRAGVGAPA